MMKPTMCLLITLCVGWLSVTTTRAALRKLFERFDAEKPLPEVPQD